MGFNPDNGRQTYHAIEQTLILNNKSNTITTTKLGSNDISYWDNGFYTVYIWYNNICIAKTNFIIYTINNNNDVDDNIPYYNTNVIQQNTNSSTNMILKKISCSYCLGTGINPIASSVPAYGNTGEKWCEVCNKYVTYSHGGHTKCPSCNGKGYIEKYVYK